MTQNQKRKHDCRFGNHETLYENASHAQTTFPPRRTLLLFRGSGERRRG